MNRKNSDGENWSQIALKNALENNEVPCWIEKTSYVCRGDEKKVEKNALSVLTSFSTVTSPKVKTRPQNFLALSFRLFAKLQYNFKIQRHI